MLDRLRVPLIVVTSLLFVYGAFTFWQGKSAVETDRAQLKPKEISLYDLEVTEPKNFGWYRITKASSVLLKGVAVNVGATSAKESKRVDGVYFPLIKTTEIPRPYMVGKEEPALPPVFVMVCSKEKSRKQMAELIFRMQNEKSDTLNDWIEQNRSELLSDQPVEGILHKPFGGDMQYLLGSYHGTFERDFWILEENRKPLPKDNP